MKVLDLTRVIGPGMSLYPGSQPPRLTPSATMAEDGYLETRLDLLAHTGTHLDAPRHLFPQGKGLDQYPLSRFAGRGCVVDLSRGCPQWIGRDQLAPHEDRIWRAEYLLLRTGWGRFWGEERYAEGYPVLAPEAAQWLAKLPLAGVGVDTLSLDPLGSVELLAHRALLGKGMVLVENLANLEALPPEGFTFLCFPLSFPDADGSPVRAAALIDTPRGR